MTWFKVDDNLAFHAKVVAAGNAAMGLWVRAGSWCSQQLTDGFVPEHIAAMLGTDPQAAKLVKAGLWVRTSGGFCFHSWEERNPNREEIEKERAAGKERKRLSRERKKAKIAEDALVSGESHTNVPHPVTSVSQRPDPTRPDPTYIPTTPDGVVGGTRKRGTRLPSDFIPSEKSRQTILTEHPGLDLRREHAKFADHWASAPGQRGIRVDWDATWRNWMRRAAEQGPGRTSTRQQQTDELFAAAMTRAQARESAAKDGQPIIEGVIL